MTLQPCSDTQQKERKDICMVMLGPPFAAVLSTLAKVLADLLLELYQERSESLPLR